MKKGRIIIFATTSLVMACMPVWGADPLPDWVRNRRDVRFSDNLFIQALGQAAGDKDDRDAVRAAEMQAQQQIAQQLQVTITSKLSILKFEDSDARRYQEQALQQVAAATSITLAGLRIVNLFFDKKQKMHYTLAVLERRVAANALLQEWVIWQASASQLLHSAQQQLEQQAIPEALHSAWQAASAISACSERETLLNALNAGVHPALENPGDTASIQEILVVVNAIGAGVDVDVWADMPLQLPSGENELVISGRCRFNEEPLQGALLSVRTIQGQVWAEIPSTTSDSGDFNVKLRQFAGAPHGRYQLALGLSLGHYLMDSLSTTGMLWNKGLHGALPEIIISVQDQNKTLEDVCAGIFQDLAAHLPNRPTPYGLAMGSITFAESRASSPFLAFLKDKLISFAVNEKNIQIAAPDKISQVLREASRNYKGPVQPGRLEVMAALAGSDGVIYGICWEREDALEITLHVIASGTGTTLASATAQLPYAIIPGNLPYKPVNFTALQETQKLGDLENREKKLAVQVWLDRGNGAVYRKGEKITIYARASEDVYLYLIYHDAAGNDILVFPNARQQNNRILGGTIYQIPDARDTFDLTAGKPFGPEIVKAVISKSLLEDLPGTVQSSGLKVLSTSLKTVLSQWRASSTQSLAYAESSCVLTTME